MNTKTVRRILFMTAPALLLLSGCAGIQNSQDRAKAAFSCMTMKNVQLTTEAYYVDTAKYPGSLKDLRENPGIDGWKGPYITSDKAVRDAWGSEIQYSNPEGAPVLISPGPDKILGTTDDVTLEFCERMRR